ncbi:MAG TPA: sulfite exporter TauE/SafE family protein [Burkholderiaceae bacterium]|jgi:hypothetical protein
MLISLLLGIFIGLVMGLTGAGGGILAVPALVAGMGWPMQQAAPVALIAVGCSAALGAIEGFQRGLVRYRAALWMAVAGAPFTALGSMLARRLSQGLLMALFAIVMLWVAYRLMQGHGRIMSRAAQEDCGRKAGHVNPDTGRFEWGAPTIALVGAIGAMTGAISGLLGVGGGFVIVPLLRRFTNVSMHGIVATSLLVVALVSGVSVATAVWRGAVLSYDFCAYFTLATGAGMALGRILSRRLPEHRVQQGFAFVLTCVALALIVKAATRIV